MHLRLKQLLSQPVFEYADTNRLKRLLNTNFKLVAVLLVLWLAAIALMNITSQSVHVVGTLTAIGCFVLLFFVAVLLHRLGYYLAAGLFLPIAMWLTTTVFLFLSGGINGPGFIFYLVVILTAHLLLGMGAGVIFFLFSLLTSLAIFLADANGWLPSLFIIDYDPFSALMVQWITFVWAGALVFIANRDLLQVLRYAQENQSALLESNRQQQLTRASLETRTHDLERRIVQLQVAAEVARDAASLGQVDELMNRVVNVVRDRFGFYHAGIFMVEEGYAVLRASTGDAGRQMLAERHKLKLNEVGIVGYVAGTGQPRIALDVGVDAVYFKNPYLPETRSEMALPLKIHDTLIGALDVQSKQSNAFDSDDVAILQTMADQLAIAIENARLFDSAKRRLEELTILHAVSTAGAEAVSQDDLIERATEAIGERLYTNNFGVLLLDETARVLRFHRSYRGLKDEIKQLVEIPMGRGVVGRVASTGLPLRVAEVTRDLSFASMHVGMSSQLCVPLKIGDQVLGVINAEHTRRNAFTDADERLLLTFAGQLATALEKVRLFEMATRRAGELEALRQASLQVTSNLETAALLEAILENAIRLVNSDTARIYLYDGQTLTSDTALWSPGRTPYPFDPPRPNGLSYTVAHTGQRIVVSDSRDHPLFRERSWDGAAVGLPLRRGERVIGVMNITYEGSPHLFDEHELRVLELLADQAAIALSNAELYAEAQERAKALETALSQRQELDRIRDNFIQNASHELRTPLTLVRGYLDLFAQGDMGELLPQQQDVVNIITRRVNSLAKLIDDITAILDAQSEPPRRDSYNLLEAVKRVLGDAKPTIERAGLALECDLASAVPPNEGNVQHIGRVIDNLISNAIKFTGPGGGIKVRLWNDGAENIFEVSDTGVGIPVEKVDRIFDRFYQVDGSTTRRYGGTGLGLALVKEIVQLHGGTVTVRSDVNHGSVFTVRLPIRLVIASE